jgi:hypothetical protein
MLQFLGVFLLWNTAPSLAGTDFKPANLTVAAMANANGMGGRRRRRRRRSQDFFNLLNVEESSWWSSNFDEAPSSFFSADDFDTTRPSLTADQERLLLSLAETLVRMRDDMEGCLKLWR